MKRTPIKKVSAKRKAEIALEQKLKIELLKSCKGFCMICGEKADWRGLSLHHMKFKSQGGESTEDNVILACGKCHSRKHGIKEV